MFELVPSQWMRESFKQMNFSFTDFQKATLIWNAPDKSRQAILDMLRKLAERTQDDNTRKQIKERLKYEEKAYEILIHNPSGAYVYVVEDEEEVSCGFFAEYDRAVKYATKYMQKYDMKCSIKKQRIVTTDVDEIVRNPSRGNPNLGFKTEEYCAYDRTAVSTVIFNKDGVIERLYSHELPKEEKIVDSYSIQRFEYHFIKMPFTLQVGLPVKDVRDGEYYILEEGEEDWNRYLQRIEENQWYVDFSDDQVICSRLTESGIWSHEHVNPLYLDVEFPPYIEDDPKRQALRYAMEAMGDYLSHKSMRKIFCPELVLKYAREYADVCRRKSLSEKRLEEAEKPEDIMD